VSSIYENRGAVESIKNYLKTNQFADPAPLHNFYKEWFNLVDLTDRLWYAVEENHGNWRWRSKLFFGIMKYFIISVWSRFVAYEWKEWIDFRFDLADQLTQINQ
jgi:hypothetical protein